MSFDVSKFPPEHRTTAQIAAAVCREMMRRSQPLGTCTSETPLLVRVNGDAADTPAKALGGWTPAEGPVACFWFAGRLYVTEVEGV